MGWNILSYPQYIINVRKYLDYRHKMATRELFSSCYNRFYMKNVLGTGVAAFDRYVTGELDTLDLQEIKSRFVFLTDNLIAAANQLPNYYKILLLSQTVQMVLGGLKAATSISLDKHLIEEYIHRGLLETLDMSILNKVLYDNFSVCVTEKTDGYNADTLDYFIYNPNLLSTMSRKFSGLTSYNDENINQWLQYNSDKPLDYLHGILYGYPLSSIKQFLKYQTMYACRVDGRRIINNYGEAYIVWDEQMRRDVLMREQVKETFFTQLASNLGYRQLTKSLHAVAQEYRAVGSEVNFEKMLSYYHNFINH